MMFAKTKKTKLSEWNLQWEDLRDTSVLGLIASNMVILVWALIEKWDLMFLMWVYLAQSLIIGFFWFFTIVTYKNAYKKYTKDPSELPNRLKAFSRLGVGLCFLFHFGFFHLGYIIFLFSLTRFTKKTLEFPVTAFAIFAGLFFINQLILTVRFARKSVHKPANIAILMGFPYARIIPMHFTIILGRFAFVEGFNPQLSLLIFLALKTIADVIMHIQQKKGFADEPPSANVVPHIITTPKSDQAVLPGGKVISLKGKDELAKKLKSVENLPPEVRTLVYKKLTEEKKQNEQNQAKVKCQCGRANRFKGKGVLEYAKQHLKLIGTTTGGTKVHYICPQTGKRWIREGHTLTAYPNNSPQSK